MLENVKSQNQTVEKSSCFYFEYRKYLTMPVCMGRATESCSVTVKVCVVVNLLFLTQNTQTQHPINSSFHLVNVYKLKLIFTSRAVILCMLCCICLTHELTLKTPAHWSLLFLSHRYPDMLQHKNTLFHSFSFRSLSLTIFTGMFYVVKPHNTHL